MPAGLPKERLPSCFQAVRGDQGLEAPRGDRAVPEGGGGPGPGRGALRRGRVRAIAISICVKRIIIFSGLETDSLQSLRRARGRRSSIGGRPRYLWAPRAGGDSREAREDERTRLFREGRFRKIGAKKIPKLRNKIISFFNVYTGFFIL